MCWLGEFFSWKYRKIIWCISFVSISRLSFFFIKIVNMQMIQSENEKQRLEDEVEGSRSQQGFSDLRK